MKAGSCVAIAVLLVATASGCERGERSPAPPEEVAAQPEAPHFVGSERCGACHPSEAAAWRASHHAKAMQVAEAKTLLGDFGDRTFAAGGVVTRFVRRDRRAFVRTEGADGAPHEYEVAYTFGVDPLQQLLLPLDRGRLQATTVAWDARPASAGGQRWFSLHGDESVPPGDPLHWTDLAQNWNASCAECHSTDVQKGYRPTEDRYETKWSEVSVGCEACHGPGSRHVAWAAQPSRAGDDAADRGLVVALASDGARWVLDPGAPIARRSAPRTSHAEMDACGRCHSRRSGITEPYVYGKPLLDTHRPALLDAELYTADGQILDEVYEWGSFLQSRMHAAGVACSDCHEPHGGALRAEGSAVCAQCHRAEAFDVPEHHRHTAGSEASRCVSCHMPTRLYMTVDARHDHSLRVPRPDLAAKLGTRDACTSCHVDRAPEWAAAAVARWYGESRRREPHFGEALHAARSGALGAEGALAEVAADARQPAIARATALAELAGWIGEASFAIAQRAAADRDPLLRLGAIEALQGVDPTARVGPIAPLLRDPVRAVRIAAANALASAPASEWTPPDRAALAAALAEWRAAQMANADRPEARVNLGALHAQLGERDAAHAEYEAALRLGPWFVPAYLNLADLLREEGRDDEAEPLLRRALEIAPDSADAQHALGLLLVRRRQMPDALAALGRAAELAPANARYAYVYAVALQSTGEAERALSFLARVHGERPGAREPLVGLATLARDAGRLAEARRWAERLAVAAPDDPRAAALLREIDAGTVSP